MRARALIAAVVLVMTACGDGDDGGSGDGEAACRVAEEGRVEVVADDIEWDVDCLEAQPGPLTVVVDNQDDGIAHNLHLADAPGSPMTQLEAGPVVQELEVDLDAGSYEYVCDIHPNMTGTLRVAPAT